MLISCAKYVNSEEKIAITGSLQYYICSCLSSLAFILIKQREQTEFNRNASGNS